MRSPSFRLRFPEKRLRHWAARYPAEVDEPVLRIAGEARRRGFLTKPEFEALGEWKTPRARKSRSRNSEALVREVTRMALSTRLPELKIDLLRLLDGVEWPTASVILHLCNAGKYPILDTRAMWSVGRTPVPPYSTELWLAYTEFTRRLAGGTRSTMREVDRALWQYSKEKQP